MSTPFLQLFFELPEDEINEIRSEAIKALKAGAKLMTWTIAGQSFETKFPGLTPAETIFECNMALKHLNGTFVKKTYANFQQSQQGL